MPPALRGGSNPGWDARASSSRRADLGAKGVELGGIRERTFGASGIEHRREAGLSTLCGVAKYDRVMEQTGFGQPPSGRRTSKNDITQLLSLADSDDPLERRVAIKNLCTCHVQADDDRAWAALLRAFDDGDVKVRREALHALTDST